MKIHILSFLSYGGQFITLGIFNFKLKCDRKKFHCSTKCEGVGEEKILEYFSWVLLPPFITIFYPLLETEVFQRAVTPLSIFLKDFILQITWLSDNLIRSSTFTVVLYWREHIYVRKFFYSAVHNLFFCNSSLLSGKSKTSLHPKTPVGETMVCFLFGHCFNLFRHWVGEQKTQFPHWKNLLI